MRKKKLDSMIQNISMAIAVFVFLGIGLPKAVAYGTEIAAVDVMASGQESQKTQENAEILIDFSMRLLQQTEEDDHNTLISPYSLLSALAMTANGANGNTRSQMEEVLGISTEELNEYLNSYQKLLTEDTENKLSAANSIWLKDDDSVEVSQEFLKITGQWYEPNIYQTPMDQSSLDEINGWVNEKTQGMIPQILNEIPSNAIMYLVNALAFDGQWETAYQFDEVRDGTFTKEDGTVKHTEMMYSQESDYLEDEDTEGFLKYYKNGKYAFAALLPREGISMKDYVENLTGEKIHRLLSEKQNCAVYAAIPKFQTAYETELSDTLSKMGMPDAFSETAADFSKMCTSSQGNVFIGRVLHKTCLEVNEQGTKASAATAVEMIAETAAEASGTVKEIYLDRPFLYMLIDTEEKLPLFLGAAMDIGE